MRTAAIAAYRLARRITIGVIGATLMVTGVAMFVLPGPGTVVLALGLAVLGIEFAWARRWLHKLRSAAEQAASYVNGGGSSRGPSRSETRDG